MKCSYCGAELSQDQKFCLFCGTRQESCQKSETVQENIPAGPDYVDDLRDWANEITETVVSESLPVPMPAATAPKESQPRKTPVRQQTAPRIQLPTGRGLGKMFFLGILTFGIYPTVIWSRIVTELNLAASRYDGRRTMPYFAMCTLAPVTFGIYLLVWFHGFCGRVGAELQRRGIDYKFGAKTFWLWNVLGSLILVGPFIFVHKLMKSMNLINKDFNVCG